MANGSLDWAAFSPPVAASQVFLALCLHLSFIIRDEGIAVRPNSPFSGTMAMP